MTAADLRAVADLLDRLAAAGFDVALEIGGDLIIRAKPAAAAAQASSLARAPASLV
jgi:hypothetical protein